ncbi:MAG: hypothetical protein GTN49_05010 [candidate division Zixibacteria bacterium]|nr:hypothetical protein [candidate division Zixibacteria bacterium]
MLKTRYIAFLFFLTVSAVSGGGYTFVGEWPVEGDPEIITDRPFGLAIGPGGNVYLAYPLRHRINYYSPTGTLIEGWLTKCSVFGNEQSPFAVDVAPSGLFYTSFPVEGRIKYYTPTGTLLGEWGRWMTPYPSFRGGEAIAVGPNGYVYVVNVCGREIMYFTPEGSFLGKWNVKNFAEREIGYPTALAVSREAGVYVTVDYLYSDPDKSKSYVQCFDASGSFLSMWDLAGPSNQNFSSASGVAVDQSGVVYVTDLLNHCVRYFTGTGSFLGAWGKEGTGRGEFRFPSDIDVAPNGDVYILDFGNRRVQYFRRFSSTD